MNILVTGGSKGLGAAIVSKLAENPANHTFFTYNNSEIQAIELEGRTSNTTKVYCDFRNDASLASLSEKLAEWDVDVLINNAAINQPKNHFHKLNTDGLVDNFRINVAGTVTITQAAIKLFRKKKSGRIITILSSAIMGKPPVGWAEYVAGKNYLLSLSRSWVAENNRFNIVSNCVSPSFMQTDFNQNVDQRLVDDIITAHPLGKLLTVEEVADTVDFLTTCSPHINGTNIVMNAGMDL